MMELSKRALSISPSLTLSIAAKEKKLKSEGVDIIGFGAGEPDFPTPQFIIQAAKRAMDAGKTRYTDAAGMPELRQAVCDKLKKDNGLEYKKDQIVVSNGAKHSLMNAFQAILNPGDEVIIPSPYWLSYPEMARMADGVPVFVQADEETGFCATPEQIQRAITPRTKALVFNSPSNPCGGVYGKDAMKKIGELAVQYDFFIISDEIYEEMTYDGRRHISVASLGEAVREHTILVNGMSKAYAMTGWRIGYTASRLDVAKVMSSIQSHATSNPNTIAQYASLAALTGPRDELEKMVAEFDRRRQTIVARVNAVSGLRTLLPGGAFYVMVNISGVYGKKYGEILIKDSMSFSDALLEGAHVAVVPGAAFGAEDYVRLSYATSMRNIEEGIARIDKFINEMEG